MSAPEPAAPPEAPPPGPGSPTWVVAQTCWGEARGQGTLGMLAVACVIRNRVALGGWWGQDWISVCRAPWQFSCWNDRDPNRQQLLAVTPADPAFAKALVVADAVLASPGAPDITEGADSYFDLSISPPEWTQAPTSTQVAQFADFVFYKTR